jgi:hypothetical protein
LVKVLQRPGSQEAFQHSAHKLDQTGKIDQISMESKSSLEASFDAGRIRDNFKSQNRSLKSGSHSKEFAMLKNCRLTTQADERPISTEQSFDIDRSAVRDFCRFSNKKAYDRMMLDSLDACYHVPTREHKFVVRGTPIVKSDTDKKYSYMSQVIKRAKSSIDPRKYSK